MPCNVLYLLQSGSRLWLWPWRFIRHRNVIHSHYTALNTSLPTWSGKKTLILWIYIILSHHYLLLFHQWWITQVLLTTRFIRHITKNHTFLLRLLIMMYPTSLHPPGHRILITTPSTMATSKPSPVWTMAALQYLSNSLNSRRPSKGSKGRASSSKRLPF